MSSRAPGRCMSGHARPGVVIDNKLGRGGTIARQSPSNPDGYTLFIHHNGMAIGHRLYRNSRTTRSRTSNNLPVRGRAIPSSRAGISLRTISPSSPPTDSHKTDQSRHRRPGCGLAPCCGICCNALGVGAHQPCRSAKGTAPAMTVAPRRAGDVLCDQRRRRPQIKRARALRRRDHERASGAADCRATLDEQGLRAYEVVVWHACIRPGGHASPQTRRGDRQANEAAGARRFRAPAVAARLRARARRIVHGVKQSPAGLRRVAAIEIDKCSPSSQGRGLRLLTRYGEYVDSRSGVRRALRGSSARVFARVDSRRGYPEEYRHRLRARAGSPR